LELAMLQIYVAHSTTITWLPVNLRPGKAYAGEWRPWWTCSVDERPGGTPPPTPPPLPPTISNKPIHILMAGDKTCNIADWPAAEFRYCCASRIASGEAPIKAECIGPPNSIAPSYFLYFLTYLTLACLTRRSCIPSISRRC